MQKKPDRPAGGLSKASMPWYMVVFVLVFVAILFFDFEHRQKQRCVACSLTNVAGTYTRSSCRACIFAARPPPCD